MNCIYCGSPLAAIDYCTGCGADVTIQKRIIRISNLLYNEGLEKAQVRDLSGAIDCLKRSLKFNKENVDARNLLGLVYFETGEVVSALSEWVISKNLNVPNNAADLYIAKLQSDKNKLDIINQTIRKYNQDLIQSLISEEKRTNKVKLTVIDNTHSVSDTINEFSPTQTVFAVVFDKNGSVDKILSEREIIEKYYCENLTLQGV